MLGVDGSIIDAGFGVEFEMNLCAKLRVATRYLEGERMIATVNTKSAMRKVIERKVGKFIRRAR